MSQIWGGITKAAKHLNDVSERRVRQLCAQNRIPQAVKEGGSWLFTGPPTVIQADRVRPSIIAMKKRKPTKGKP